MVTFRTKSVMALTIFSPEHHANVSGTDSYSNNEEKTLSLRRQIPVEKCLPRM